jgi:hypothetical protein
MSKHRLLIPVLVLVTACNRPASAPPAVHTTAAPAPTLTPSAVVDHHQQPNKKAIVQPQEIKLSDVSIDGHSWKTTAAQFKQKHGSVAGTPYQSECADVFDIVDDAWMNKTYGKLNADGVHPKKVRDHQRIEVDGITFLSNSNVVILSDLLAKKHTLKIGESGPFGAGTTTKDVLGAFPQATQNNDGCQDNSSSISLPVGTGDDGASLLFDFHNNVLERISLVFELC